jgi:hypothetical protein
MLFIGIVARIAKNQKERERKTLLKVVDILLKGFFMSKSDFGQKFEVWVLGQRRHSSPFFAPFERHEPAPDTPRNKDAPSTMRKTD